MVAVHFLIPIVRVIVFPYSLFGLIPLAFGVALNLLADRAFKKHSTTVKPFERSSTLVTKGVFAISRNPMYLGMVLSLIGVGILLGSLAPFVVVPVIAVLLDRRFIAIEEPMLGGRFGEDWAAYRSRVRRWL